MTLTLKIRRHREMCVASEPASVPDKEKCPHCGKYFSVPCGIAVHIAKAHERGPGHFECGECRRVFTTKGGLAHHITTIHVRRAVSGAVDRGVCQFCGGDSSRRSLKLHMKHCHSNPDYIPWKGHRQSEETRMLLSEIARKDKRRRVMRNTQLYHGILCDSSWSPDGSAIGGARNQVFEAATGWVHRWGWLMP